MNIAEIEYLIPQTWIKYLKHVRTSQIWNLYLKEITKLINIYVYRDFFWWKLWEIDMNTGSLFRAWTHEVWVRKWGMWDKKREKSQ